jgi:hypothetical protein
VLCRYHSVPSVHPPVQIYEWRQAWSLPHSTPRSTTVPAVPASGGAARLVTTTQQRQYRCRCASANASILARRARGSCRVTTSCQHSAASRYSAAAWSRQLCSSCRNLRTTGGTNAARRMGMCCCVGAFSVEATRACTLRSWVLTGPH